MATIVFDNTSRVAISGSADSTHYTGGTVSATLVCAPVTSERRLTLSNAISNVDATVIPRGVRRTVLREGGWTALAVYGHTGTRLATLTGYESVNFVFDGALWQLASVPLTQTLQPLDESLRQTSTPGLLANYPVEIYEPFGMCCQNNLVVPHLPMLRAAGVQWLRLDCFWGDCEESIDAWDFSVKEEQIAACEALGIKIILVLTFTPTWASSGPDGDPYEDKYAPLVAYDSHWEEFCFRAMTQFGKRVVYEIWNEPDHDQFFKVATGCWAQVNYPAETAVNQKRLQYKHMFELAINQPAAAGNVITTGGAAQGGSYDHGFWDYMAAQPNFLARVDVANYHGYGYPSYEHLTDQIAYWTAVGATIGRAPWDHWITEHGIVTLGVPDANIKQHLIRSYALAMQFKNVKKLFWYRAEWESWRDGSMFDDEVGAASTPGAAFYAMALLSKFWDKPTSFTAFSSGTARGTVTTRYQQSRVVVLWADSAGAAINSYGFDIRRCVDQDGYPISADTLLSANPVIVELND